LFFEANTVSNQNINEGWVAGLKWVSMTEALILEARGEASRTGRRDDQGRMLMQRVEFSKG
jgi:hypothetical protein